MAAPELLKEPFGPYLLLRPLGKGGMGVVYVALSRDRIRPLVALKRLRPDAASVPTFSERFEHEAQLALRLSHDTLVPTLDVGTVQSQAYVASELILGQDARAIGDRLVENGRGAPVAVTVRIMLDVLRGLAYAHGARDTDGRPLHLVHRDVTAGNVIVGYDGVARLADFGLAKSVLTESLQLTAEGTILGTPAYMSPETIKGETATALSDLYSLGAVAYRLLTGYLPYEGAPREVVQLALTEAPRPIGELRPDLPRWFVDLVERLMARDPRDRPASAREAHSELSQRGFAHRALASEADLGAWLRNLFALEFTEQMRETKRFLQLDPGVHELTGEHTRVLRGGPAFMGPDASDLETRAETPESTQLTESPAGPAPALGAAAVAGFDDDGGPTAPKKPMSQMARVIDIAARAPTAPEPHWNEEDGADEAPAEERPRVPGRFDSTTRMPSTPRSYEAAMSPGPRLTTAAVVGLLSVMTLSGLMVVVAVIRMMGSPVTTPTDILLLVASALIMGIAGGVVVVNRGAAPRAGGDVDPRRWDLRERLGGARIEIAKRRRAGQPMPEVVDTLVTRVQEALTTGDLELAQADLQELEICLVEETGEAPALRTPTR